MKSNTFKRILVTLVKINPKHCSLFDNFLAINVETKKPETGNFYLLLKSLLEKDVSASTISETELKQMSYLNGNEWQ